MENFIVSSFAHFISCRLYCQYQPTNTLKRLHALFWSIWLTSSPIKRIINDKTHHCAIARLRLSMMQTRTHARSWNCSFGWVYLLPHCSNQSSEPMNLEATQLNEWWKCFTTIILSINSARSELYDTRKMLRISTVYSI